MTKQAHFEVFQNSNEHATFSFWWGIQKLALYLKSDTNSKNAGKPNLQFLANPAVRTLLTSRWRNSGETRRFSKIRPYRGVGDFDLILPSHAHCRGRRDCDCVLLILLHPAHDGAAIVNVPDILWLASAPPCWSFPCRCGCLSDNNA